MEALPAELVCTITDILIHTENVQSVKSLALSCRRLFIIVIRYSRVYIHASKDIRKFVTLLKSSRFFNGHLPSNIILHARPRSNKDQRSTVHFAFNSLTSGGTIYVAGMNKSCIDKIVNTIQKSPDKFDRSSLIVKCSPRNANVSPLPTIKHIAVLGSTSLLSRLQHLYIDTINKMGTEFTRLCDSKYVSHTLSTIHIGTVFTNADFYQGIKFLWLQATKSPSMTLVCIDNVPTFASEYIIQTTETSAAVPVAVDGVKRCAVLLGLKSASATHVVHNRAGQVGDKYIILSYLSDASILDDPIVGRQWDESAEISMLSLSPSDWIEQGHSVVYLATHLCKASKALHPRIQRMVSELVNTAHPLQAKWCTATHLNLSVDNPIIRYVQTHIQDPADTLIATINTQLCNVNTYAKLTETILGGRSLEYDYRLYDITPFPSTHVPEWVLDLDSINNTIAYLPSLVVRCLSTYQMGTIPSAIVLQCLDRFPDKHHVMMIQVACFCDDETMPISLLSHLTIPGKKIVLTWPTNAVFRVYLKVRSYIQWSVVGKGRENSSITLSFIRTVIIPTLESRNETIMVERMREDVSTGFGFSKID